MTEHEKHAANLRDIEIILVCDGQMKMADALREAITYIEQQAERERWVPVSERLPDDEVAVWISFLYEDGGRDYATAYLDGDDWIENGHLLIGVTHWREIVGPEEG